MLSVRVPRTLPKILAPAETDRLLGGLRTDRDRAMLLAGLRRCEVLGLRFEDMQVTDRRLAVGSPMARALAPVSGGLRSAEQGIEQSSRRQVDPADRDEVSLNHVHNAVGPDAQAVILTCVEALLG